MGYGEDRVTGAVGKLLSYQQWGSRPRANEKPHIVFYNIYKKKLSGRVKGNECVKS